MLYCESRLILFELVVLVAIGLDAGSGSCENGLAIIDQMKSTATMAKGSSGVTLCAVVLRLDVWGIAE